MLGWLSREDAIRPFIARGYVEHTFSDGWVSLRPPPPSSTVVMLDFMCGMIQWSKVQLWAERANIPGDEFE